MCLLGWQYVNIGSDNGLALIKRQAIIWNSDDLIYWHMYASLSHDELSHCCLVAPHDILDLRHLRSSLALFQVMAWCMMPKISSDFCKFCMQPRVIFLVSFENYIFRCWASFTTEESSHSGKELSWILPVRDRSSLVGPSLLECMSEDMRRMVMKLGIL